MAAAKVPLRYTECVTDNRGNTYYRGVPGKSRRVCWWWNRNELLWCVYVVDLLDNQIGGSQYVPKSSLAVTVDQFEGYVVADRDPPIS